MRTLFAAPWVAIGLASAAALRSRGNTTDPLSKCPGYKASSVKTSPTGLSAALSLGGPECNVYGDDLKHLSLEVSYDTETRLHVKIQDVANDVYQVPESVFPRPDAKGVDPHDAVLKFDFKEDPFSFRVSRSDSGEVLFDTSAANFVFESQYLRLRTSLPEDPNLYGLGEHTDPFRLGTKNYSRTLWSQDAPEVPEGENLYGNHPVYVEHRLSGTHGVFFLNSNGMDVVIHSTATDGQYLEYNTLGGVFDFYFVAGPSPSDVARQYAEIVGLPAMMPYWGLGFQQCRYGYRDAYEVAEVVYNHSQAKIPLEVMWTDIDYMDGRKVFSLDPERFPLDKMRALVDHLHKNGQKYVVMVDPAVAHAQYPAFERGVEDNIFLLESNGSVWKGVVWPGVTAYPDWFSENITKYWQNEFHLFFNADSGVDIDALWIDMNEPSNFCLFPCESPEESAINYPPKPPPVRDPPRSLPGWPCEFQPPGTDCESGQSNAVARTVPVRREVSSETLRRAESFPSGQRLGLPGRDLLYPKYAINNSAAGIREWNAAEGGLSNRTMNTDVIHQNGLAMYDTHNLYGTMMSAQSRNAMLARRPGLRPMIITRSTFAGAGAKVGHWLGDNVSSWSQYRWSIRSMMAFASIYQVPMVGSDVCGFLKNTTEPLCARWATLGAFNPFYRNHNSDTSPDQEFYRWDSVAAAARKAIDIRYRLLDYIYTALYRQHVDGTPTLNPVFYLYPQDSNTFGLDLQFFYGDALLVAPVTQENATSVDVYLPKDVFYDWYTGKQIAGEGKPVTVTDQQLSDLPLYLRGGVVVPARTESAMTTDELRTKAFELIVPVGADGRAAGQLYVDDGVSIEQAEEDTTLARFAYADGRLSVRGRYGRGPDVRLAKVTILGYDGVSGGEVKVQGSGEVVDVDKDSGAVSFRVDRPLTEDFDIQLQNA